MEIKEALTHPDKMTFLQSILKKAYKEFSTKLKGYEVAERYYRVENDILTTQETDVNKKLSKKQTDPTSAIRMADNRVPHNYFPLILNQKAGYLFTIPPQFDVGEDKPELNKKINTILGSSFSQVCKRLSINAGIKEVGWLHCWVAPAKGRNEDHFKYAVVPTEQVIPVYGSGLEDNLDAVVRFYIEQDYNDSTEYQVFELWDGKGCYKVRRNKGTDNNYSSSDFADLMEYESIPLVSAEGEEDGFTSYFEHSFAEMEEIPFIPFYNNGIPQDDLVPIKRMIDVYDSVYSGFANDLEDIQEIIWIITNYGGADLDSFMNDLNRFKSVKVDDDGEGLKGGVETMTIQIPVEARDKLLEITRKEIFIAGQGVNPHEENLSNTSGTALKFIYSLLELKAGLAETEFRVGFDKLIMLMMAFAGDDPYTNIQQEWKRSSITNTVEEAEVIRNVSKYSSQEAITKANPIVDNWQEELEAIERDKVAQAKLDDLYKQEEEEDPLKDLEEE